MIKQRGFGLLTLLFTTFLAALMVVVFSSLRAAAQKAEYEKWEKIANGQIHILNGYEKYFEYDCYPDGIVTSRNYSYLTENGFIDEALVYNIYDFGYSLSLTRPSYSFDTAGKAISSGSTIFTLIISVDTIDHYEKLLSQLKRLKIDLSYKDSTKTITLKKAHTLSNTLNNYKFLRGTMSYTCS